jgi:hypothetical protein
MVGRFTSAADNAFRVFPVETGNSADFPRHRRAAANPVEQIKPSPANSVAASWEFTPVQSGIRPVEPEITGKKVCASFDDQAPQEKE